MWQRFVCPSLGLLLVGAMLTALGCAHDKPTVPEHSAGTLAVSIVGGPDASVPVVPGAMITFKWQATGGSGTYSFTYKLDAGSVVTVPTGQTSVVLVDPTLLTTGSHAFTVNVNDGTTTANSTRSFAIAAASLTVDVTFPPAGYKLAPGGSVRFEWQISDPSKAYKIGWAVDDTTGKATWQLSQTLPTAGFGNDLALGWHYIYVRIQDLGGAVTTAKDSVEVIAPTILYVNEVALEPGYAADTPPVSEPNKFRRSRYFWGAVFDGFAVQEWNVAELGYPTIGDIPPGVTTIVWVGSGVFQLYPGGSWGYNVGYDYSFGHWPYAVEQGWIPALYDAPNVITDFIDAGGKVWITGENWLEEINPGADSVFANSLEYNYLGMDTSSASFGPAEVVFDFAAAEAGWPDLSSDIAKLSAGLGDHAAWTCDFTPNLKPGVLPLYRVSGYDDGGGLSVPPPEDDWYAAWLVNGSGGNPQVVFMGFDVYYFSADAGREVGRKILHDLFGN